MKCNTSASLLLGTCLLILNAAACVRRSSHAPTIAQEDSEFRAFLTEYEKGFANLLREIPRK
jgi:hypothetical protein